MTNILVDILNELSKPAPPPTPWEKFKSKAFDWGLFVFVVVNVAVWLFGWMALITLLVS